jgi:hypothetical protein
MEAKKQNAFKHDSPFFLRHEMNIIKSFAAYIFLEVLAKNIALEKYFVHA